MSSRSKSILIISDFDHFLLSDLKSSLSESNVNVKHYFLCEIGKKNRIKYAIKLFFIFFYILLYSNKYHCVSYHYATKYMFVLDFAARLKKMKRVCTIWGSEFLKASNKNKQKLLDWYINLDKVSVTNYKFLDLLIDIDVIKTTTSFGLSALNVIEKIDVNSKKRDLINIVVGTNASKNQQHIKILMELKLLPRSVLSKFNFIVPLTYGADADYVSTIKKIFSELDVSVVFIERPLSIYELAELRLNTDILIQLQETDQLSAAMTESIYAGAHVITGSWLPYDVLDNLNIKWSKIDNFNELSVTIQNIELLSAEQKDLNRIAIGSRFSWTHHIESWLIFFFEEN